jgi:hypothetical protein
LKDVTYPRVPCGYDDIMRGIERCREVVQAQICDNATGYDMTHSVFVWIDYE